MTHQRNRHGHGRERGGRWAQSAKTLRRAVDATKTKQNRSATLAPRSGSNVHDRYAAVCACTTTTCTTVAAAAAFGNDTAVAPAVTAADDANKKRQVTRYTLGALVYRVPATCVPPRRSKATSLWPEVGAKRRLSMECHDSVATHVKLGRSNVRTTHRRSKATSPRPEDGAKRRPLQRRAAAYVRLGRSNVRTTTCGRSSPKLSMMSRRTMGVAVAVHASKGTDGKVRLSAPSARYLGQSQTGAPCPADVGSCGKRCACWPSVGRCIGDDVLACDGGAQGGPMLAVRTIPIV